MVWESVIGLEVHVQLATRSKLFCGCSTAFGDVPNTNVCPVCLGLPGALPVPNEQAVRLATRAALALGATVQERSVFARKNYFYPDLPKGYQISQYSEPLAIGGAVPRDGADPAAESVRLVRLHVEEDAGKLLHDRLPGKTAIDLNRAGVPLVEIVTAPDLRSPVAARTCLVALREVLVYAGVSECSMEQGSLRVDANLSLRRPGDVALGTKTEVKNLNSFANLERALEAERSRQIAVLESGATVAQVTLLFDAETGAVTPTRSKEESHDYRYFPDPDLPPLVLPPAVIEAERRALPELPQAKRARWVETLGIPSYHARVLTGEPVVAAYFEAVVEAGAEAGVAANWVTTDALAGFNRAGAFAVAPARLARLIGLVAGGTVSHQAARKIFAELEINDLEPDVAARAMGLEQVRDAAALDGWVEAAIATHPAEAARYRAGEHKLLAFFVGQVMKMSRGQADPKAVSILVRQALG